MHTRFTSDSANRIPSLRRCACRQDSFEIWEEHRGEGDIHVDALGASDAVSLATANNDSRYFHTLIFSASATLVSSRWRWGTGDDCGVFPVPDASW